MKQPDEETLARMREGHRERLRRRFVGSALESFQPYEVVEFLLSFLIPRRDVKPLAKSLVERFHGVSGFLDAEIPELVNAGLTLRIAVFIRFLRALLTFYHTEKVADRPFLGTSEEIITFLQTKLGGLKKETLQVLYLDTGRHLLGTSEWSGTVNSAVIAPREIAERALLLRAAGVILVHNHPSGNCKPSAADVQFTKSIYNALDLFDIKLLDHIIIARQSFVSLME